MLGGVGLPGFEMGVSKGRESKDNRSLKDGNKAYTRLLIWLLMKQEQGTSTSSVLMAVTTS